MRLFFYLADSLSLRVAVRRMERSGADVVIFDRYIYDELANLPLRFDAIRFFVKAVLRVVPKPDAAFLIDADPAAARARKPEYPLEFLYRNRESYLVLSHLVGDMIVIEPQSVEAAQAKMRRSVAAQLPLAISEQSPIVLLP
jgi:thymidylate kinase